MPPLAGLVVTALLGAGAVVSESRPVMGTLCTVTLSGVEPSGAAPALEAAFAFFDRVDLVMNEWRPESPLSALNAAAGQGWVALPGDLCEVLAAAKAGAERTGGRFDPTWAALSDLWRFDGSQRAPPAPAQLAARCPLVDHRGLELAPRGAGCRARLVRAGMRVGLGGLAKGWAVDQAARALRALGLEDFLLQAGGDLYAAGQRGDAPWRVAVRDPRGGPTAALGALEVRDQAFSTSGDSERYFEAGGRRYHHLIDPRTCRPAEGARSVTILARTALEAEVLSKAAMVEGGAAGVALVAAAGAQALLVDGDGALLGSPALLERLERAPTSAPPPPPPPPPPGGG